MHMICKDLPIILLDLLDQNYKPMCWSSSTLSTAWQVASTVSNIKTRLIREKVMLDIVRIWNTGIIILIVLRGGIDALMSLWLSDIKSKSCSHNTKVCILVHGCSTCILCLSLLCTAESKDTKLFFLEDLLAHLYKDNNISSWTLCGHTVQPWE